MSQESLIFLLGLFVAVMPFLGIPDEWKNWLFVAFGVLILIVGYRLRRASYFRSIETSGGERRADAFVENRVPATAKE